MSAPLSPPPDPGFEAKLRSIDRWRSIVVGAGIIVGGVVGQMFARRFGNGTPEQEAAFFSAGLGAGFALTAIYADGKAAEDKRTLTFGAAVNEVAGRRASGPIFGGLQGRADGQQILDGVMGMRGSGGPIRTNVAPTGGESPVRRGSL